jgi:hypothetical protein
VTPRRLFKHFNDPALVGFRYGQLIDASHTRLRGFQTWCISHTQREANEVAHLLAKAAIKQSLDFVWKDLYSDFIQHLVLTEQVLHEINKTANSPLQKKKKK